jgi:hypothetical protein
MYLNFLKDKDKHEDFVFEIYEPTLKLAGTSSRPFSNFTKENIETFTRLKWRWVDKFIVQ